MPKRKATIDSKNKESKNAKLDDFGIKSSGSVSCKDNWINLNDVLVYNSKDLKGNTKICGFDMDYTLICPKSGKKWPQSWDDWKFLYTEIPQKLKSLKNDGYKIVIFTNQGGVEKGNTTISDVKNKLGSIMDKLGFEVQVFASLTYGKIYRKPAPGMFQLMEEKYNDGLKIDTSNSIYCGDAAGRPANWAPGKKKDFNNADLLYAKNLGLQFKTPEELFLNQAYPEKLLKAEFEFDPFELGKSKQFDKLKITSSDKKQEFTSLEEALPKGFKEKSLILLVGNPGAGKSTFAKKVLEPLGFSIINRDTLKTPAKCLAETEKNLVAGKSVVIDNTNPDKASRQNYIDLAKTHGANHTICMYLDVSLVQAKHNEAFRRLTKSDHERVSEIVYRIFKSKFVPPTIAEGFTKVLHITPEIKIDDEKHRKLYCTYISDAGY